MPPSGGIFLENSCVIRFDYVWRFLPILIIGTNCLPKQWVATCLGLVVLVRRTHFYDLPTIAHELAHCRQTIKGLGLIHFSRYHCVTAYRFKCEAEAFAEEINQCTGSDQPSRSSDAIDSLTHCYRLNCTPLAAREAIQAYLHKKSVVN